MINDLVKRLRADELPGDRQVQREARTTLWSERHEAADCIEKLQAANLQQSIITVDHLSRIEKLQRALEKIAVHHRYNEEMASIARKALEDK